MSILADSISVLPLLEEIVYNILLSRGSPRKKLGRWVGRYSLLDPTAWGSMGRVSITSHQLVCCERFCGDSGADIDTLLIAPRHIERTDFFTSFHEMLLSERGITNVRAVPDAFVPLIKIEYEGIEVWILDGFRPTLKEVATIEEVVTVERLPH